jgi:tetratricopeptide (TPR) repeat protein
MKLKPMVSQNSLARMLQAATEAWRSGDFEQAIETFETASRRDPANHGVLLDLGRAYGLRFNQAAAEKCFEKAIRISPNKTQTLGTIGQICRDFGDQNMAERYLSLAAQQKDITPETLAQLAEVYERLRRMENAYQLVERALKMDPKSAPTLLTSARLRRQSGQLEAAECMLRDFPVDAGPELRARAAYELGAILDRQERYDEAMTGFLKAKELLRPLAARPTMELKVMRDRLRSLRNSLTSEVLDEWHKHAPELQPTNRLALLAGHPRSGTTLLEQVLDSHPDIVSAEETEIFLDDAFNPLGHKLPEGTPILELLRLAGDDKLRSSRVNYFRSIDLFLGNPVGSRLLIDKNPSYTFLIAALARIFPEIKLIIALRDPRDVCLSCFMQNIPMNQVGAAFLSLESTVQEYGELMGMWKAVAPMLKNPWIEIRYEDMVGDLESVARKTLDFLGMGWDARVLGFDEHARKKLVRSPTYADVAKPIYRGAIGRWRNYQEHLNPHLAKLETFIKAFGYV